MSDPSVPAAVQHVCSSSHVFCRLCEEGMAVKDALAWAKKIEAVLDPVIYSRGDEMIVPLEALDH